jgi:hypothetical protein
MIDERICRTFGCEALFEAGRADEGERRWCAGNGGRERHAQEWRGGRWTRVEIPRVVTPSLKLEDGARAD